MKITDLFRFIGENGSGYVHGEIYMLEVWGSERPVIKKPLFEAPRGYPNLIQIPYDSWNAFFENWERC